MYVPKNYYQKYYQSSVKRSNCTYPKTSFRYYQSFVKCQDDVPKNFFQKYYKCNVKMYAPKNFFQNINRVVSKCTYPKTSCRNTFRVVSNGQNKHVRTQKLLSEILSEKCQTVKMFVPKIFQNYYQCSVKRSKCTYPKTSFRNTIRVVSNTQKLLSEVLSD